MVGVSLSERARACVCVYVCVLGMTVSIFECVHVCTRNCRVHAWISCVHCMPSSLGVSAYLGTDLSPGCTRAGVSLPGASSVLPCCGREGE